MAKFMIPQLLETPLPRDPLSNRQRRLQRAKTAKVRVVAKEAARSAIQAEDRPRTAIQRLKAKNRLDGHQARALEHYGQLARTSWIEGPDLMKSCLGSPDRVSGGQGGDAGDYAGETAQWLTDSRRKYALAIFALADEFMIAACDVVAGQGQHPRDVTKNQLEQEQVETTLRLAANRLVKHFAGEGRGA